MKQRKRVTPRRGQKKISQLRASAEGDEGPLTRLQKRRRYYKAIKKQITLYLDADVLDWFKRAGRGVPDADQSGAMEGDDGREEDIIAVRIIGMRLEPLCEQTAHEEGVD